MRIEQIRKMACQSMKQMNFFFNNSKIVLKSYVFIVLLNFDIEKNILPLCDSFAQEVIEWHKEQTFPKTFKILLIWCQSTCLEQFVPYQVPSVSKSEQR